MREEFSKFLTDVLTAAGLVANGRQDKGLASRLKDAVINLRNKNYELEAENATLRQQRDAANAQINFILENLSNESTRNSGKGI